MEEEMGSQEIDRHEFVLGDGMVGIGVYKEKGGIPVLEFHQLAKPYNFFANVLNEPHPGGTVFCIRVKNEEAALVLKYQVDKLYNYLKSLGSLSVAG